MKKKDMKIGKLRHCIGGLVGLPMVLAAQNPIVQTMYTADPAPMVYDGKLFFVHQSRRRRVNVVCHERMETVFHDRHGELDRPRGSVVL